MLWCESFDGVLVIIEKWEDLIVKIVVIMGVSVGVGCVIVYVFV